MNEQRIHQIFEISVLLKGAHALLECVGGLALAFVSTANIAGWIDRLTQDELIEDPHDYIATHLLAMAQGFSLDTKNFYVIHLLLHGIVKLGLVAGLLKNKLWSYPASLIILGLFMIYQIYRYYHTYSLGLLVLTAFDAVVMALIWHEYRLARRHRIPAAAD